MALLAAGLGAGATEGKKGFLSGRARWTSRTRGELGRVMVGTMLQFPEIVSPLSASVGTSSADRSRAITASFLPPLARPTAADKAPPAPTTALHRLQHVHGRHHDHHWAATNAATRKARSRTRGVPVDGRRRGNNNVRRRAGAQRGGGGRVPCARAAQNKCLRARARAQYELMRCTQHTLATTPR